MLLAYALGVLATYTLLLLFPALLFIDKERRRYARHHLAYQAPTADADGCKAITVGVFHPYANGGGGGERVMYCALLALTKHCQRLCTQGHQIRLQLVLYTGDDGLSARDLLTDAAARFNLPQLLSCNVHTYVTVVTLPNRELLDPSRYPRFTLLWQSLAHMRVASTAFQEGEKMGLFPQVWLDTTGCAFSYLIASIRYGCTVLAYVHYPMISTDMIAKVWARSAEFNNDNAIATSSSKSMFKYFYYRLFAMVYGAVGYYCTNVVMVNSTWTYNHIRSLWSKEPLIVYPPCGDMKDLTGLSVDNSRACVALSIAQFRPEKNHVLQLQALQYLLHNEAELMRTKLADFQLILLGSCRNEDDEARVVQLRERCVELDIPKDRVVFIVNASFEQLHQQLARASIGIHTMYNEHFGISIVEMMAAGLIVVANNSGGPASDIVEPGSGMLALTAKEYANRLKDALLLDTTAQQVLRSRAREASMRFSDDAFGEQFLAAVERLFIM